MKKIVLVCSAGMSTSLLVTKMKDAAKSQGIETEITAVPEVEAKNNTSGTDVVLLAPQVRYLLNRMKKDLEPQGIPVAVIESINYGMMNGEAVIKQAMELMKNK
ncbi:MAG: PTS sugar transporter subunit IIB [Clostridiales bacterium GWB2_37_7]|nr:MAG: PTS sugar transporter subunit IIB [Clostridiales bacterium GWB2_37_7]